MALYKDSGVDIERGEEIVKILKPLAKSTHIKGILPSTGGFGGIFDLKSAGFDKPPVLVVSTDGVGSKLKFALKYGYEHTIGIDLVAMNVNDVICEGATPLLFSDYYATDSIDLIRSEKILNGIVLGCQQAGCALISGETAEMPTMLDKDEIELAGFCVGAVNRTFLRPFKMEKDYIIIGLFSSGIHSNGFSLIREDLPTDLIPVVMEPTMIYAQHWREVFSHYAVATAHITGGGLYRNIPRIIPDGLCAKINLSTWELPKIFKIIQNGNLTFNHGSLTEQEMLKTFNCGIGMVFILNPVYLEEVIHKLNSITKNYAIIGKIIKEDKKIKFTGRLSYEYI